MDRAMEDEMRFDESVSKAFVVKVVEKRSLRNKGHVARWEVN